jgi:hypothetical protein
MLFAITGLLGRHVEASDGRIGAVTDFLFDDRHWKIRWMVVDAKGWLPGRELLIHPSAIEPLRVSRPRAVSLPMLTSAPLAVVSVRLTKQKIEASPETSEHEPLSKQMEARLYEYYGWDPLWDGGYLEANAEAPPLSPPPMTADLAPAGAMGDHDSGDPHLQSAVSANDCRVNATDGGLGHVENLLVDDASWRIRYLVVTMRKWWPGKHVRLAPATVADVDWGESRIDLNLAREQVKSSPEWDPLAMADDIAER